MRWRIPIVTVLPLFVAVSCDQNLPTAAPDDAEATGANFKVVENSKDVWTWWQVNACTGEVMDVEFRMHVVQTVTVDATGAVHTIFTMNPMGSKAVGQETGMVCNGVGPFHDRWRFRSDGSPASWHHSERYHWVCPGPRNDVIAFNDFVIHTNAHGDITVELFKSRLECMGPGGPK